MTATASHLQFIYSEQNTSKSEVNFLVLIPCTDYVFQQNLFVRHMLTAYRGHQGELLLVKLLHIPALANKHVLSYLRDTHTRAIAVQF
jgi:hypothetical protein